MKNNMLLNLSRSFTVVLLLGSAHAETKIANSNDMAGTPLPHISAMLEVASESGDFKGFLMPRMSSNERQSIPSPALGLQVYDEDLNCITVNISEGNNAWQCLATQPNQPWYASTTTAPATSLTEDIYHHGNVGLGITTPSGQLHVHGSTYLENLDLSGTYTSPYDLESMLLIGSDAGEDGMVKRSQFLKSGYLNYAGTDLATNFANFRPGGVYTTSASAIMGATSRPLFFFTDGNDVSDGVNFIDAKTNMPYFRSNSDGSLRISGSNAIKASGTTWINPSDRRIKKNIEDFNFGLETAMKLDPVVYEFNGKGGMSDDGTKHIGFIAQEVKEVAPYMVNLKTGVTGGVTDMLTVDESALSKILLNSIQEQQAMITELQEMNKELMERVKQLEEK